jgi:DNA-directed RNA polymerase specialized sigma24 family protein
VVRHYLRGLRLGSCHELLCGGVIGGVGGRAVGDDDGELFSEVYPALRRFASAVRPVGVDADDLVQEAVARTLAARSFSDLDDPLAYLRAAVLRVAINSRRSKRRSDARVAAVGAPVDGRVDDYPSDLADLWRVSAKARAVLFLTVIEVCSYREAAEMIGCSEAAARQMASRALRQLRLGVDADLRAGDSA